MNQVQQRKSNIELLRIITMLMIVAHHYVAHGIMMATEESMAYVDWVNGSYINKIISCLLYPGGGGRGSNIFPYHRIFSD